MSNDLLKKHQKTDIRFQQGDFILYEPTAEQYEAMQALIKDKVALTSDYNMEGSISFDNIKFIIREMTNVGTEIDKYSDAELKELLDNGDRQIQLLLQSISELLNEVAEDVFTSYMNQMKTCNQYLKVVNNLHNIDDMKAEFNKLCKENNLNMTFDDLKQMDAKDEKELTQVLEKVNMNK